MRAPQDSEQSVPHRQLDRLNDRARFVRAVDEGLADGDAGRLRDHDEVVARMKERFGAKPAP
jgi:predicted transcriptional regulator